MSTIEAVCDDCLSKIEGRIYEDYDGIQRCYKCHLKSELYYAETYYKSTLNWLKITHIRDLKKTKHQIIELKRALSGLSKEVLK